MISSKFKNGIQHITIFVKREFRKIRHLDTIYVVGDSHSLLFQSPIFQIIYIGPATAYRLGSKTSTNNSNQKVKNFLNTLDKNKVHKVMFVFGEIDCRIHINKFSVKSGKNIDLCIKDTIKRYISALECLQKEYPNIVPIVFNILPPGEQGNIYNVDYYASRKKRMEITRRMNHELSAICKKRKIPFIDVFNKLITSNDERIKKYIFDEVHYNGEILQIIINALRHRKIITTS